MTPRAVTMALVPRDGFFFKDGRGWYTSDTNRARTLTWPFPSTVRGALVTACGFRIQEADGVDHDPQAWEALKHRVTVSALLPLRRPRRASAWRAEHRAWPVPRDTLILARGPVRLEPLPRRAGVQGLGMTDGEVGTAIEALWHPQPAGMGDHRCKPLEHPAWWDDSRFTHWLCAPSDGDDDSRYQDRLEMARRVDIKVVLDSRSLVAREGGLYTYEVLESLTPTHEWALGVRATFPAGCDDVTSRPLGVGGKRRILHPQPVSAGLWEVPKALWQAFGRGPRGLRLVVVTPGHFPLGWCLPGFSVEENRFVGRLPGVDADLVLMAAIVPGAETVSGWDLARRRPKSARRLVPPGSVYFLQKCDREPFTSEEARSLWLAAVGDDTDDGFGRVVPGVWHVETRGRHP